MLAAAGSIDHDALVELALAADAAALPASTAPLAPPPPDGQEARMRFIRKDTEQYHVCLGAPGIARDDDRRWALRVLDNVLGGTSSSRLFQEVRERRGLAYSVYSFSALHAGAGQVGLYVGTRPDNVGAAMQRRRHRARALRRRPGRPRRSWPARRRTSRGAPCSRWSRRPRG